MRYISAIASSTTDVYTYIVAKPTYKMRSSTIAAAALALSTSVTAQNKSESALPGLSLTSQLQLADR